MRVYHRYGPGEAREGVGSPGAGVIGGGEPVWVLGVRRSGSLEEQPSL